MNTSAAVETHARAHRIEVNADTLTGHLVDGRVIAVPIAWFPRLLSATQAQRDDFELLGGGVGIHWPQIDEDLSVAGLLRGERGQ